MAICLTSSIRFPIRRFILPIQCRCISQSPIVMSPRIIDAIKDDHRELEDYYNKILTASTDKEKTQWQNQFSWELARHSIGEELVVYPVFEKSVPGGRAMADKDRKEHYGVHLPSLNQPIKACPSNKVPGQRKAQEVPKHESL